MWIRTNGQRKKTIRPGLKKRMHERRKLCELLEMVAQVSPDLRIRFSTSHPKDITDDVLAYDGEVREYLQVHSPAGSKRKYPNT